MIVSHDTFTMKHTKDPYSLPGNIQRTLILYQETPKRPLFFTRKHPKDPYSLSENTQKTLILYQKTLKGPLFFTRKHQPLFFTRKHPKDPFFFDGRDKNMKMVTIAVYWEQ